MHMLGLSEAADTSDLLFAMGKIPASHSMLQDAALARERAANSSKRAAEEAAAVPVRRPRRVPGGDPLDVSRLDICACCLELSCLRCQWPGAK